jgi:hypothetical protein
MATEGYGLSDNDRSHAHSAEFLAAIRARSQKKYRPARGSAESSQPSGASSPNDSPPTSHRGSAHNISDGELAVALSNEPTDAKSPQLQIRRLASPLSSKRMLSAVSHSSSVDNYSSEQEILSAPKARVVVRQGSGSLLNNNTSETALATTKVSLQEHRQSPMLKSRSSHALRVAKIKAHGESFDVDTIIADVSEMYELRSGFPWKSCSGALDIGLTSPTLQLLWCLFNI